MIVARALKSKVFCLRCAEAVEAAIPGGTEPVEALDVEIYDVCYRCETELRR